MIAHTIPSDRVLALLAAITAGAKGKALCSISGSRQTLVRDLHALRRDFGCRIDWDPKLRRYLISDTGAISPRAIRSTPRVIG